MSADLVEQMKDKDEHHPMTGGRKSRRGGRKSRRGGTFKSDAAHVHINAVNHAVEVVNLVAVAANHAVVVANHVVVEANATTVPTAAAHTDGAQKVAVVAAAPNIAAARLSDVNHTDAHTAPAVAAHVVTRSIYN